MISFLLETSVVLVVHGLQVIQVAHMVQIVQVVQVVHMVKMAQVVWMIQVIQMLQMLQVLQVLPSSSLAPSDERGELEALGGDGAVEAVTEVEGGVGQHDVGAAQDARSLVRFLGGGVQDRPVPLRDHSLFLK